MSSSVFVCKFVDGEVTRMSTFHPAGFSEYNLRCGVRLSLAAYESRKQTKPPRIAEGHFETQDGDVLKTYELAELLKAAAAIEKQDKS